MCGIAGIAGEAADRALPAVEEMVRLLRYRGPDASGVRDLGGCTLGHARLRIIDLSPAGDQPMGNEDQNVWVTFNGEIYNFPELRRELEDRGHRFTSETDTEVLVHLYEEHGEMMAERLRGMFAFAIWDEPRGRLLLCRDRLGIKPLYYRMDGRALRFASEARAVAGAGLDHASLASFLRLGWVAGPATIFPGVSELPPGHVLVFRDGRAQLRSYWCPPADTSDDSPDLADLRAALRDAMERHLVADVPVGLFLSSGMDSSALAHLASQVEAEVRAYTVSFDAGGDESVRAAEIASMLRIPHTVVPVRGEEILSSLDMIVAGMDQPTVDGVNSWVICQAVREVGLVVALSGLGGDELFWGYSTFRHIPLLARAGEAVAPLPAWARRAPAGLAGRIPRMAHSRARRALEAVASGGWGSSYAAVRGLFSRGEIGRLWPESRDLAGAEPAEPQVNGLGPLAAVARLELANYLPFQLLRDTDAMSMAHSIEVRVPLLDDEVVKLALRCQQGVDGLRGKRLLAAAVHPSLLCRAEAPKRTFTLPFDSWLHGPLRNRAAAALDRLAEGDLGFDPRAMEGLWRAFEQGRAGWRPVWALAVLGMWLDAR